ncbi:MAG: ABC transporter ATP-binding protein [Candidatus Neomarinimicrobiota bacterium]
MEASITLKNISKHFDKKYALSNLTLGVEKGSVFAVTGRSGAGKSTLLRVLSTMMTPDEGLLFINEKECPGNEAEVKRSIGYLPDHDIHDPWLTGWENLQQTARLLEIPEDEFERRAKLLIADYQLEDVIHECPVVYSKGKKRILDIIQVLLNDPEILILDEPFQGLDYYATNVLNNYLISQYGKKTIVIASHEFSVIQTFADRWIVLHQGKIRFDGTLEKMASQVDVPFIGYILFKQPNGEFLESIKGIEGITEIRNRQNTVEIVADGFDGFSQIMKKIDFDTVISIGCNAVRIDEFINQLLSDEGF